ncbi:DUF4174 domain-containing protein [Croceiramulus getboli]|nr:DUF4174 domain-containing protein [Flavobacteriaceae bacterium YJPT1-3]
MRIKNYFILLILSAAMSGTTMNAQSLKEYLWKNRLILLLADEFEEEAVQNQLSLLLNASEGLDERDIKILIVGRKEVFNITKTVQTQLKPQEILTEFQIMPNFEGILLIGKDGTPKHQAEFPCNPAMLFDIIDSMPMRQAEMNKG